MQSAPDLVGRALDARYEVHELLGEGAFGTVYRGVDRRLGRAVAIKVIKPWWAQDSAWVQRFQHEARLLARVNDPGVVQIFDIGDADEGPYYVTELVDGESLAERLCRGPLPPEQARGVAEQLCAALASAHRQGVLHCDVKPANVLLRADGAVKVGDFGIARLAERSSQASLTTVAGTPRYMSPEQARGAQPSAATDVYGAGVVLYEMLAGRPPFEDGSPVELGLRHLLDPPPPLPSRVPPRLRSVVQRALAKDPAERFHDGGEMAAALSAARSPRADARQLRASQQSAAHAPPDGPRHPQSAVGSDAAVTAVLGAPHAAGQERASTSAPTIARTQVQPRGPANRKPAAPSPGRRRRRRRTSTALAGTLVLLGAAIAGLLIARQSAHTTVPELRRLPRGGVQARAARLHLRPVFSRRYAEAPADVAIAQAPAPGARLADGSTVHVVLSAGPPPVSVPDVTGEPAASAESRLATAGLRYATATVAAPGSDAGLVVRQSPSGSASRPRGSTVALSLAEQPRWRPLTTFSGTGDDESVAFRTLGSRWRVVYSMSYQGTCLLLFKCLGPSARAQDLNTSSTFDGFGMSEGSAQTHTFDSRAGLYRVEVSAGVDSAEWTMTVQDYY